MTKGFRVSLDHNSLFQEQLKETLDFIKKDMGYSDDEFEKIYHTKKPLALYEVVALQLKIQNEIEDIFKWSHKEKKPISQAHLLDSLFIGPLGLFSEAIEQKGRYEKI